MCACMSICMCVYGGLHVTISCYSLAESMSKKSVFLFFSIFIVLGKRVIIRKSWAIPVFLINVAEL